ncbi:DoxX family membrane protein [Candidatus Nanohalovita haloferacivicina]|uniref:DoxX family membrane protein n=1 Tax=Candidatus Nanohalovita haloferacivicina TaxID=2978046 RepID=UPI00325FDF90
MSLYRDFQDFLAQYPLDPYTVFRTGLGLMILLSGIHKLVDPVVWSSYIAPTFADLLNQIDLQNSVFMQINGVFEIIFGTSILLDKYTTAAAGVVTLSLAGIIVNLGLAGTGYLDIIIRDLGLLLLSTGVTLQAVRREKK